MRIVHAVRPIGLATNFFPTEDHTMSPHSLWEATEQLNKTSTISDLLDITNSLVERYQQKGTAIIPYSEAAAKTRPLKIANILLTNSKVCWLFCLLFFFCSIFFGCAVFCV